MSLIVTYHGERKEDAGFRVIVDGTTVGYPPAAVTEKGFFDIEYSIPADLVRGKDKVTVRFEATGNNGIATVFGVRMLRSDGGGM